MDEVDIANWHSERLLRYHLNRRIRYIGHSNTQCEGCDNEIPELRRKAVPGVKLCIDCAERDEHKQNQYART